MVIGYPFLFQPNISYRLVYKSSFLMKLVADLQLPTFAFTRLLNKPYENEVTLTGQKPPLNCCMHLEILYNVKKE